MNFHYILYRNLSTLLRLGGGNVSLLQLWTLFLLWWVKRLSRDYLRPPLTVFGWRNLIYPQPWKGSLPRGHFFGKTQNFSNWYFICMYWVTTKKYEWKQGYTISWTVYPLIHSLQGWWRGARFLLGPWRRQVFCR